MVDAPPDDQTPFAHRRWVRWIVLLGYELNLALRWRMLHASVALLAMLAGISASLGLRDVAAARPEYTRLVQEQVRSQLSAAPIMGWELDPRLRAIRPPEPGAALAPGVDAFLPAYWDFSPAGVRWGPDRRSATRPAGRIPLDFGLLVMTIGGLLAGMYGVQIVAHARTTGTLRARLSLPVAPALVISAPLAAAALVAVYAVVVVQLVTLAGLVLNRPAGLDTTVREIVSLVVPLGVPAALFLWFMIALGGLVRLLARSDAGAHLTQVALWAVIALLVPSLTFIAARVLVPVAPRGSLEHAADERLASRITDAEYQLGALIAPGLDSDPDPETIAVAIDRDRLLLDEAWRRAVGEARVEVEAMEQAWCAERRQQFAVLGWLDWLSPGALLIRSIDTLAGTGQEVAEAWERSVRTYQQALNRVLFDDRPRITIRLPAEAGGHWVRFDRHPSPKLHELPRFERPELDRRDLRRNAVAPLAGLAAYALAFGGLVSTLFRRRIIQNHGPASILDR